MLTLLTATGMRPEAWKICQELMRRQTYAGDVTWIIVDDGAEQQSIDFKRDKWNLIIVRPEVLWQPETNTQASNLRAGMRHVYPDSRLVIIEDDDCYHPQWLERVNGWLDTHDLVGESFARYYNIAQKKARQLNNQNHASLCATGMKGEAILTFAHQLKTGAKFIDLHLWGDFQGSKKVHRTQMVTGIKGLPGRTGIGMGHSPTFSGQIDHDGKILRQWVEPNSDLYG